MNRYFSYEHDEDFDFDYDDEIFDPGDYPARKTVDYMDYCYTYHFDGSARIQEREED